MQDIGATRPRLLRSWLIWMLGFLAFPIAGVAASVIAGRIDSPAAAVIGGAVAGLVVGAGQALVSRGRLDVRASSRSVTIDVQTQNKCCV